MNIYNYKVLIKNELFPNITCTYFQTFKVGNKIPDKRCKKIFFMFSIFAICQQ